MEFKRHKSDDNNFCESLQGHVAMFERVVSPMGREMFTLVFCKPGDSAYWMHYTIRHGYLTVTGDAYDGVYQWSGSINWAFLAGCNLGYFREKCRASVQGYYGLEWSEKEAEARIMDYLREYAEEEDPPATVEDKLKRSDLSISDVKEACEHQHLFANMLYEHTDSFGDTSEMYDMGMVPSREVRMHFLGLHYAMQLVGDGKRIFAPENMLNNIDFAVFASSESSLKDVRVNGETVDGWRDAGRPPWLHVCEEYCSKSEEAST